MMLTDMRDKGATDDDLKQMISVENYERYKLVSAKMNEAQVSGAQGNTRAAFPPIRAFLLLTVRMGARRSKATSRSNTSRSSRG